MLQSTLSKAITQVQKARKALSTSHGKYPDDCEIAKFTGLSLAKITSASKCLRVVGSIDQTIGEFTSTKFLVRLCILNDLFTNYTSFLSCEYNIMHSLV